MMRISEALGRSFGRITNNDESGNMVESRRLVWQPKVRLARRQYDQLHKLYKVHPADELGNAKTLICRL